MIFFFFFFFWYSAHLTTFLCRSRHRICRPRHLHSMPCEPSARAAQRREQQHTPAEPCAASSHLGSEGIIRCSSGFGRFSGPRDVCFGFWFYGGYIVHFWFSMFLSSVIVILQCYHWFLMNFSPCASFSLFLWIVLDLAPRISKTCLVVSFLLLTHNPRVWVIQNIWR